jgi:adenylate cyclase
VAFYPELVDEWFEDGRALATSTETHPGDHANPLLSWLLREAPGIATPAALTHAFIGCMLDAGIPVWRVNVIIRTLHPQVMALAYRWWQKNDAVEEVPARYELLERPQFQNSPLVPLFQGAGGIRRRLDGPQPQLDFPILEELHAEGGTDYVAMPMRFSDGQINVVSLASARPGGFSTEHLGHVYEVLEVLGRIYEVHALRYRANTLLDTYLGHHAGARVLAGLIKRGDGEDINAVLWFCDLRESTTLAQSMSRRDFLGVLDRFFDCMAGAVMEHGGEVLRFIGDAALAIFPITPGHEQRAHDDALAAALAARDRMHEHNVQREQKGRSPLQFGIALHPGEVTYGNIGTASRLEFTVIGDAANRAARVESLCKVLGQDLLVSAAFARRFPDRFQSLGSHRLRGLAEPIELFALRD